MTKCFPRQRCGPDPGRPAAKLQALDEQPQWLGFSDDILILIFSFLPFIDAVRIGLLCSRFRNLWLDHPTLSFGIHFMEKFRHNESNAPIIIDRVLHRHCASKIFQFQLLLKPRFGVRKCFKPWMLKVKDRGVEELDLAFHNRPIPFSPRLFEIDTVRVCKLSMCQFFPGVKLSGMRALEKLVLDSVWFKGDDIEGFFQSLFCNCLLLKALEIANCCGSLTLKVSAQNLKWFRVLKIENSSFCTVQVESPTLSLLHFTAEDNGYVREKTTSIKLQGSMPQLKDAILSCHLPKTPFEMSLSSDFTAIRALTASSSVLEGLTRKGFKFPYLKELQLLMDKPSYCNPYDIVCFIKSCPLMDRIFIDFTNYSSSNELYWDMYGSRYFHACDWRLDLKHVVLKGLNFDTQEVDLVKFFLHAAKSLQRVAFLDSEITPIVAQVWREYCTCYLPNRCATIVTECGGFLYPRHGVLTVKNSPKRLSGGEEPFLVEIF